MPVIGLLLIHEIQLLLLHLFNLHLTSLLFLLFLIDFVFGPRILTRSGYLRSLGISGSLLRWLPPFDNNLLLFNLRYWLFDDLPLNYFQMLSSGISIRNVLKSNILLGNLLLNLLLLLNLGIEISRVLFLFDRHLRYILSGTTVWGFIIDIMDTHELDMVRCNRILSYRFSSFLYIGLVLYVHRYSVFHRHFNGSWISLQSRLFCLFLSRIC